MNAEAGFVRGEPDLPPILSSLRPHRPAPVAPAERIETLDVLRGFALFGILLVNMALFSRPIYELMLGGQAWGTQVDVVLDWVVRILAEGSFYPLFSFLFGLGAALQMKRFEERGAGFVSLYVRRLLVLLGIGLGHAFLLWEGDILVLYSVMGFLLLAFCRCQPRTLLVWTAVFLVIPVLIYAALWAFMAVGSLVPEIDVIIQRELAAAEHEFEREAAQNIEAFAHGSLGEIFVQRAQNVGFAFQYTLVFGPIIFAMFLVGLYAGRRGILQNVAVNLAGIRRMLVLGLCIGLPAKVLYAVCFSVGDSMEVTFSWVVAVAALAVGGPALCFFYVAGFTLLVRQETWRRRLRPVAAAGRMALSNYLFQSLVCTTLFYSYGLGWYGSVGRAEGLGLAVLIYVAQLPLSVWWLNRFRFGPVEWLWRSLTYGQRQPMRLRSLLPGSATAI